MARGFWIAGVVAVVGVLVAAAFGGTRFEVAQDGRAAGEAVRFERYDLIVDTGGVPLGAWQVRVSGGGARARLVGIRGGDADGPWAEPASYDPRALHAERIAELEEGGAQGDGGGGLVVVLASLTTERDVPGGSVLVGRLNVMVEGGGGQGLRAVLEAAAGPNGESIGAGHARLVRVDESRNGGER